MPSAYQVLMCPLCVPRIVSMLISAGSSTRMGLSYLCQPRSTKHKVWIEYSQKGHLKQKMGTQKENRKVCYDLSEDNG